MHPPQAYPKKRINHLKRRMEVVCPLPALPHALIEDDRGIVSIEVTFTTKAATVASRLEGIEDGGVGPQASLP